MWAEVNGERKKVACCERVVINYTIPKTSECACPSERAPPTATVAGNSRITKSRRKSAAPTPYNLEKAIQAGFDAKTETSSVTYTPSETSNMRAQRHVFFLHRMSPSQVVASQSLSCRRSKKEGAVAASQSQL
ncbi:unnamed protein product [Alternaria alternata]